jgi:hypothetical protein
LSTSSSATFDPDPKNPWDCEDDGYQFHLEALRPTKEKKSGKMSNPYDTAKHNLYRFGGQTEYVKQYWIELLITGTGLDQVAARVYHHYDGPKILATEPSQQMKTNDFMTIQQSSMGKALKVTRMGVCQYEFDYGTDSDGFARVKFNSDNDG